MGVNVLIPIHWTVESLERLYNLNTYKSLNTYKKIQELNGFFFINKFIKEKGENVFYEIYFKSSYSSASLKVALQTTNEL